MAKGHSRRQRKKLHLGEFQELGFEISAKLTRSLTADERDSLINAFLDECIEPNNMGFGGGVNDDLGGYVCSFAALGSLTDADRDIVGQWLRNRPEFTDVKIGELNDAWYGHE